MTRYNKVKNSQAHKKQAISCTEIMLGYIKAHFGVYDRWMVLQIKTILMLVSLWYSLRRNLILAATKISRRAAPHLQDSSGHSSRSYPGDDTTYSLSCNSTS